MSDQTQIPTDIAVLIEHQRALLLEEKKQKEEAEQRQQLEWRVQGEILFHEFLATSILLVPEFMRPYLDNSRDVDYERIGKGWDRAENNNLYFAVPGLAPIEFDPQKKNWRSARARWNDSWDSGEEPYLNFNNSFNRPNVEDVLLEAQIQMRAYQEYLEKYQVRIADAIERREKFERDEQSAEERAVEVGHQRQLKEMQEQAEEQALFDAIKSDPFAMHMLKAFVLIRDERSTFDQLISEADEAMYSMESYWTNKAADLRRQAGDAERRAEEERYRLQNDLDDTEAKLRKAEKAQRGS